TGCRRGDACTMGWQHVKDGWLCWTQQKTGTTVEIPIAPPLAEALEYCDRGRLTFLETEVGTARSPKAYGAWFAKAAKAAGVAGKTAHGLRHDFGARGAEAGIDAKAGAEAMGHATEAQQAEYRRQVERRKLAARMLEGLYRERNLETAISVNWKLKG
ncbi:MAG: tyrosine-type recombinase/integrase, partial [Pseudomonadota bacterium]